LGVCFGIFVIATGSGNVLVHLGRLVEAEPLLRQGLALARELGNKLFISEVLLGLGNLLHARGDLTQSRALRMEALQVETLHLGRDPCRDSCT